MEKVKREKKAESGRVFPGVGACARSLFFLLFSTNKNRTEQVRATFPSETYLENCRPSEKQTSRAPCLTHSASPRIFALSAALSGLFVEYVHRIALADIFMRSHFL